MWGAVLKFVTGGFLTFFSERHDAHLASMSEERRLAHNERQTERRNRKDIRIATSMHWEMRLITFLIAFPFVAHFWSVYLDTQFKFEWNIDKFPEPFNEWQGSILLSFFGVSAGVGIAKAISGAIIYRGRK